MKLEQTLYDNSETGCCARLDVGRWDGKTFEWRNKPFLKDHMRAFLYIPLDFGSVISREHSLIQQAGAYPEEPFWLTDEVSPWGADVYMALDRSELPGAEVVQLSGTFLSKVFEGPYRDAGKFARQMEDLVHERGRTPQKLYFYYATCPRCVEYYGKNQIVVLAQLGPSGSPTPPSI